MASKKEVKMVDTRGDSGVKSRLSLRSRILCAANSIRNDLIYISSYKAGDIKYNDLYKDEFRSHVLSLCRHCQDLLDISQEV